jgi:hypothetical protein
MNTDYSEDVMRRKFGKVTGTLGNSQVVISLVDDKRG